MFAMTCWLPGRALVWAETFKWKLLVLRTEKFRDGLGFRLCWIQMLKWCHKEAISLHLFGWTFLWTLVSGRSLPTWWQDDCQKPHAHPYLPATSAERELPLFNIPAKVPRLSLINCPSLNWFIMTRGTEYSADQAKIRYPPLKYEINFCNVFYLTEHFQNIIICSILKWLMTFLFILNWSLQYVFYTYSHLHLDQPRFKCSTATSHIGWATLKIHFSISRMKWNGTQ